MGYGREWWIVLDDDIGNPLGDIKEFMIPPYSEGDVKKCEKLHKKERENNNFKQEIGK